MENAQDPMAPLSNGVGPFDWTAGAARLDGTRELRTAWLAGIYEGEGCVGVRGRSIRVEVVMTDHDVIRRVHEWAECGSLRGPIVRGTYKPTMHWSIGRHECVLFLERILPLLGERRGKDAESAIAAWKAPGKAIRQGDTHCIYGHPLTDENTYQTYGGSGRACRECRSEATRKYREANREAIRQRSRDNYAQNGRNRKPSPSS